MSSSSSTLYYITFKYIFLINMEYFFINKAYPERKSVL